MGYRDDNILADDRADAALKRLLDTDMALPRAAPPDLVARTLNRLPPVPPARAAQHQATRRRQMRIGAACLAVPLVLVAVWNVVSVVGSAPQMAFLFGDGRSGASSALLSVQLAAKPFWNTLGSLNRTLLAGGLLLAAGGAALWWRLVRNSTRTDDLEDV